MAVVKIDDTHFRITATQATEYSLDALNAERARLVQEQVMLLAEQERQNNAVAGQIAMIDDLLTQAVSAGIGEGPVEP